MRKIVEIGLGSVKVIILHPGVGLYSKTKTPFQGEDYLLAGRRKAKYACAHS